MEAGQLSVKQMLSDAMEAEKKKDTASAIELYKKVVATDPLNISAYDRLMKVFRQEKKYKNELTIIGKGINAYEKYYQKRKPKSQKISDLSQKLNRSFGLVDKGGNALYDPEPIARWKKRKLIVEKKLK